jgi:hypothetical protein
MHPVYYPKGGAFEKCPSSLIRKIERCAELLSSSRRICLRSQDAPVLGSSIQDPPCKLRLLPCQRSSFVVCLSCASPIRNLFQEDEEPKEEANGYLSFLVAISHGLLSSVTNRQSASAEQGCLMGESENSCCFQ